jgi:hypothetical protein
MVIYLNLKNVSLSFLLRLPFYIRRIYGIYAFAQIQHNTLDTLPVNVDWKITGMVTARKRHTGFAELRI